MTRAVWRVVCVSLLMLACSAGPPPTATPSPTPTAAPIPSFVPLADADCPIPAEIDEGAFRAAICPTIVGAVNALRGRDIDALIAVTAEESVDCAQAVAEDPEIVAEFPQCGAVPPPILSGYVWCAEPVAPTCQIVAREEFAANIRERLESADPTATDEQSSGEFRVIGFDLCGGTQVLRTTLIARPTAVGAPPERWVMDIFMRRRPLTAEEPVSDNFLIRRVDAAPIDRWLQLSGDPLTEGRCGELLAEPLTGSGA